MTGRPAAYRAHLRSPYWRNLRRDVLLLTHWKCERCGVVAPDLEIHHKHYRTLGHEGVSDVECLCPPCHRDADKERGRVTQARVWAARVDGWATAVYGEDWDDTHYPEDVEREFEEWLDIG